MKRILIIIVVLFSYVTSYASDNLDITGTYVALLENATTPPSEQDLLPFNTFYVCRGSVLVTLEKAQEGAYYEWYAIDQDGKSIHLDGEPNGNFFGMSLPGYYTRVYLRVTLRKRNGNGGYQNILAHREFEFNLVNLTY